MKPLSISLKNYKSYGDNETSIRLDIDSVRLIIGKSGSGKTSIVDAIIWCLYGKSLANSDDVINRSIGKNCKIEFTFSIGEDEFSVIRYRKHDENGNKVLIFKNNKNISPVKISDANQLVQDIIEISYNSFVSSIIFSGEIYSSFMREKNSVRLNIFEGILSLRQVNKWSETTKKISKPITEKIREIESKKESAVNVVDSITDNIKSYKEGAVKTLSSLKEEKAGLKEGIENLEKELEDINNIDVDEEIKKIEDNEKIISFNEEIEGRIETAKSKLPDLNSVLIDLNSLKTRKEQISKIDPDQALKEIAERERIEKEISNLTQDRNELRRQIIDLDSIKKERAKVKKEISVIEREMEKISHEMACPTCGQDLPEELSKELGLIEERKNKKNSLEERTASIDNEIKSGAENNELNENKISELSNSISSFSEVLSKVNEVNFSPEEIRRIEKEQAEINTNIKILEQDYTNKEDRHKELSKEIKSLEKEKIGDVPETSKYSKNYLESVSIKLLENKEIIDKKKKRIDIIDEKAKSIYDKVYVENLENKREKLVKATTKLEKDLEKKNYDLRHYNFLNSLFSNKEGGIKKFIIGQMIGVFNEEVNRYIPLFFEENIEIEFDKNLIETIKIDNEEVDFNTFSSGEKTRFEFAIAFSLFMLVKNFFSKDVNFIVFDEILDMNLDEESLEKVLSVVRDLGDNNAILVVSHRGELRDIFTNHIIVSKGKNDFSVIKEN